MITSRLDEHGRLMYGTGLANTLCYMMSGFRGWELYGLVKTNVESVGCLVDPQGATTNEVMLCAVYGKEFCDTPQSDCPMPEIEQIQDGKTAIILFKGVDNTSWMRRMKPEEFHRSVIREFIWEEDDLFYNS